MSSLDDRLSELSGYAYRSTNVPRDYSPSNAMLTDLRVATRESSSSRRAVPLMLLLIAVICIIMLRKRRQGEAPTRPTTSEVTVPIDEDDGDDPLFQLL